MSTTANLLVGTLDNTAWVKVEGRGSFQISAGLKDFFRTMMERGFRKFAVDLKSCELMDSTFMGTLAGLALKLRESGGGSLRVVNASPRNRELLAGLGLDHLFEVHAGGSGPAPAVLQPVEPASQADQRQVVLDAHEALAAADAANAVKFQDVIEFLKKGGSGRAPD